MANNEIPDQEDRIPDLNSNIIRIGEEYILFSSDYKSKTIHKHSDENIYKGTLAFKSHIHNESSTLLDEMDICPFEIDIDNLRITIQLEHKKSTQEESMVFEKLCNMIIYMRHMKNLNLAIKEHFALDPFLGVTLKDNDTNGLERIIILPNAMNITYKVINSNDAILINFTLDDLTYKIGWTTLTDKGIDTITILEVNQRVASIPKKHKISILLFAANQVIDFAYARAEKIASEILNS